MEPLGLRPFFNRDVDRAAHPAEVLQQRRFLRREDAAGDDLATVFAHGSHGGSLVDVEADVLCRSGHESRSLRWSMVGWHLHGSRKGRALNIRQGACPRRATATKESVAVILRRSAEGSSPCCSSAL